MQDQIRATSRLSLTLGLRYEWYQPEQDRDGFYSYFVPRRYDRSRAPQILPANGQIVAGTENFGNGIVVAGKDAPFGNTITNTIYNTFAPRGGFSYALTKDNLTVLRGGFGMFHDRWAQNVSTLRNNYPFNQSASIFTAALSNPAAGQRRLFPIALTNFASPWNIPYYMKWSMGVQRQLPGRRDPRCELCRLARGGAGADPRHQPAGGERGGGERAAEPECGASVPGFRGHHDLRDQRELDLPFAAGVGEPAFFARTVAAGVYTFSRSLDNNVTPINSYAASEMERAVSSFDQDARARAQLRLRAAFVPVEPGVEEERALRLADLGHLALRIGPPADGHDSRRPRRGGRRRTASGRGCRP